MSDEENIRKEQTRIVSMMRKLHRAKKSCDFIESCQSHGVTPSFARLAQNTKFKLAKCNYSPGKIADSERKSVYSELKVQKRKVEDLQQKIFYLLQTFKNYFNASNNFEIHNPTFTIGFQI